MAIFNSYVNLPEGRSSFLAQLWQKWWQASAAREQQLHVGAEPRDAHRRERGDLSWNSLLQRGLDWLRLAETGFFEFGMWRVP